MRRPDARLGQSRRTRAHAPRPVDLDEVVGLLRARSDRDEETGTRRSAAPAHARECVTRVDALPGLIPAHYSARSNVALKLTADLRIAHAAHALLLNRPQLNFGVRPQRAPAACKHLLIPVLAVTANPPQISFPFHADDGGHRMASKIRIKLGEIEVDYEGSEEFLKNELPGLLSALADLRRASSDTNNSRSADNQANPNATQTAAQSSTTPTGELPTLTTGSIAARLQVSSGPDLAIAAAARFNLIAKRDTFTRQELLTEMKTASAYYKTSMSDNLTKHIRSLVKQDKLVESAKNVFSLSAATQSEVAAKLAK